MRLLEVDRKVGRDLVTGSLSTMEIGRTIVVSFVPSRRLLDFLRSFHFVLLRPLVIISAKSMLFFNCL